MFLQTIKSRDGRFVYHGTVTWKNGEEFGFIPQGQGISGQWWCKLDYWELIECMLPFFKIVVSPGEWELCNEEQAIS